MNWSKTSSGRWAAALIAVIGMVFVWLAVYCVRKTSHGEVGDFGAYYVAAQALCRHGDPYAFTVKPYIYPPLFATLCMPLASLPMTTAAALYVPVLMAAMLLSLFWGAREMMDRFDVPPRTLLMAAIVAVTLLIMEDRIKSEFQMFQVNALLMCLFTLSLRWLDRRPAWAGVALGLAMNIKGYPIIMLPYLLFRRRWMTAGAMAVSTVVFGLLPALAIGWRTNLHCLAQSSGGFLYLLGVHTDVQQRAQIKDVTASYSISITSGMARVAGPDHALLAWILVATVFAGTLAFGIWAYHRVGRIRFRWPDRIEQRHQPWRAIIAMEWGMLIALALLFGPQTNSRHLVMMTTVATLASVMLFKSYGQRGWMPVLTGTALLWAGLTLPPGYPSLYVALNAWRRIGGPSWLMLVALAPLLWGGFILVRGIGAPRKAHQPPGRRSFRPQNTGGGNTTPHAPGR